MSCITRRSSSRLPNKWPVKALPPRQRSSTLEKASTSATSGRRARWRNRKGRASEHAQPVRKQPEEHLRAANQRERKTGTPPRRNQPQTRPDARPGAVAASTTSQPRMRKLATVLPTRMVQRKFSGFSRYSCSTLAEGRPARAFAAGSAAGSAQRPPPPCPTRQRTAPGSRPGRPR